MKQFKTLQLRHRLAREIRRYFDDRDYLEVTTPVRIPAPAPEEYIESIPAGGQFLRTSPELAMKVLLSRGYERIYQLGPAFRAEERGRRHREEFTILEYYQAGLDYLGLLELTAGLLREAAQRLFGVPRLHYRGNWIELGGEPERLTVAEAFRRFAGCSVEEAEQRDCFDELMVTKIEPELGRGRPTFLCDYPAARASLARLRPDDSAVAERWELYLEGLELANAYGELIDSVEQRRRFREAAAFRARQGMLAYPEPEDFFAALDRGLPPCSGCALGFDRLVMVFADAADIAEVVVE